MALTSAKNPGRIASVGKERWCLEMLGKCIEFGAQALAHYLRDHSITINDMMVKDKVSGTTFVVSALPHKCIFQEKRLKLIITKIILWLFCQTYCT